MALYAKRHFNSSQPWNVIAASSSQIPHAKMEKATAGSYSPAVRAASPSPTTPGPGLANSSQPLTKWICWSWAAVPGAGQQGRAQEHKRLGGTALRCASHSLATEPLWLHHVGTSFPFFHPSKFTGGTWDIVSKDKKSERPEWCSFGSGFFSQQHRRWSPFLVKPSNIRDNLGQSEHLRPQTGDPQEK